MSTLFVKSRAYTHIRAKLLRGEFSPGRGLSNRALARELGISPIPVREAICQLEAEGVLEQRPRSGTYPRMLSTQEWLNLIEMREVLEGNAAFHAAARIKPRQITRMQSACDQLQRAIEGIAAGKFSQWRGALVGQLTECELAFHKTILEAAGNPLALNIVDQFQVLSLVFEASRGLDTPLDAELVAREEETQREHLDILAALRHRDPDGARAAIVHHFTTARRWCPVDLEYLASRRNATR